MSQHDDWVKYPTGKIKKGGWCKKCMRYNVRNSTVDMIVTDRGKGGEKVLLHKRKLDPQKGWWALMAGYVGWNESLEETARRELKEETNLDATSVNLFRVYSDPKRDLDGRQNLAHVYIVKARGKVKIQEEEVLEVKWFDLDNLPEKIAFDHRKMLKEYKESLDEI